MPIEDKAKALQGVTEGGWHAERAVRSLVSRFPPSLRFVLLLLPRFFFARCGATRVAAYAALLSESKNNRLADWCWDRAIRLAKDEWTCARILQLCIGVGQHSTAAKLAKHYYDKNGMMPSEAVRLTGALVLANGFDAALEIYDRLLQRSGDDLIACWPAPRWPDPPNVVNLRANLAGLQNSSTSAVESDLYIDMARLCFSFEAFEVSAGLFERVADPEELGIEDRIAYTYAVMKSGGKGQLPRMTQIVETSDPDWLVLLASIQFACGAEDSAAATVTRSLRVRFEASPGVEHIVSNCRHMVASLARCPARFTFTGSPPEGSRTDKPGLRKIFICGNGWSGSGALYDALAEYEGFAEAPDTPVDRYVNQCTGNEMMLVQGAAGLGQIWRKAKNDKLLMKQDLWELFRCHVLGGGAIGFTEHKGAKTAADFLMRMGSSYTEIFRQLFESVSVLPTSTTLEQFQACLIETTEAFSVALTDRVGEKVLFNNAVFGSNIDMLEIFTNFRAAVVVRDPLDQFVDRRNHDLKHWMTAARFVGVYRDSRFAFFAKRDELQPRNAREIKEVEFEQFVLDREYRQDVLDWLLEGEVARRNEDRFDPERSAQNIGIHNHWATRREQSVLNSALAQWRRS